MQTVTIKAPAKLNLFLEVTDRLDNGYHLLQSVMQSVTLYDTLDVSLSDTDGFYCSDPSLMNGDNLVIKAKNAFFDAYGSRFPLDIRLVKRIPVAAGLAGGSTDCAAMLRALNLLTGEPFGMKELCALGKSLGADVPFCLQRGTKFAEGIGEVLMPLPRLPECTIVISVGDEKVATKEAFQRLDSLTGREIRGVGNMLAAVREGSLDAVAANLYNVFEQNVPFIAGIKRVMKECGALSSLMSGSGPSVFGVFRHKEHASEALGRLQASGFHAYLCEPENNS